MKFKLTILLLLPGIIYGSAVRTSSLGLEGHSYMSYGQMPYIFVNPATAFAFKNSIYFEYSDFDSSGGIFFQPGDTTLLALFSGRPVNHQVLNSASGPRGILDTAASDYRQFFDSQAGGDLDAAATTGNFGSLGSRVELLDDVTANKLISRQAEAILAFDLGRTKIGFLAAYGYASQNDEYNGTTGSERLRLFKSETELSAGLFYEPALRFIRSFDTTASLRLYSIQNEYNADSGVENIRASLASQGAHDLAITMRLGFAFHPSNTSYIFFSSTFLDSSSTDNAKSTVSTFALDYHDTYSRTGWQGKIGVSNLLRFSSRVHLLTGVEFEYFTHKNVYDGYDQLNNLYARQPYESYYTFTRVPLIISMSAQLVHYLQVHFSLVQYLLATPHQGEIQSVQRKLRQNPAVKTITSFEKSSRTTGSNAETDLKLGFTFTMGNLSVDWLNNIELFRQGPYLLSGKSQEFSSRLAVTINFDRFLK